LLGLSTVLDAPTSTAASELSDLDAALCVVLAL
jgi:hypothetical protein